MAHSSAWLRLQYESFKGKPLLQQIIRVSCALYASFIFWNITLSPDPHYGISRSIEGSPTLTIIALLLGAILNATTLLVLSNKTFTYALLPALGVAFYLSTPDQEIVLTLLVPLFSIGLLSSVQLIIWIANAVNRF